MNNNKQHLGNYSAWVIDDADPTQSGMVKVFCPSVHSHLQEMIENPRIIRDEGYMAGMTKEEIEQLKEVCPWATIGQPLIGVGGSGYDRGGSSSYAGDGAPAPARSSAEAVLNFLSSYDENRSSKDLIYITKYTYDEDLNQDPDTQVLRGFDNNLLRQPSLAITRNVVQLITGDNDNPKKYKGSNVYYDGKFIGIYEDTNTYQQNRGQLNLDVFFSDPSTYSGASAGAYIDPSRLEFRGKSSLIPWTIEGSRETRNNPDLHRSSLTESSEENGNIVTQKPSASYSSLQNTEGVIENDNGSPSGVLSPQDASSYKEFLDSLGLKNVTPDQVIRPHNNSGNSLPPRELWANIVPTLRVIDQVAPKLGGVSNINSVYRSPSYNKSVGGATQSQHMKNTATDVQFGAGSSKAFEAVCEFRGQGGFFGGVGWYPNFLHIDTRGKNNTWGRGGCAGDGQSGDNQCDAFTNVGNKSKGENQDRQVFKALGIDLENNADVEALRIIELNKQKATLLNKKKTANVNEQSSYNEQLFTLNEQLRELWIPFQQIDDWNDDWDDPLTSDYTLASSNSQINPSAKNYNSAPYSNKPNGAFSIPKTGSRVFVFFEGGNPDFPVVFANNPTPEAYKSIYNVNSPTSDYPDGSGEVKHASRLGSRGGGMSIYDSDGREGLKIDSSHGDQLEFHAEGTSRFATKNDSVLVKGDQFNTVRGNHNTHIDGDSDNLFHGHTSYKYGDVRVNYKATEKIKNLIKPLHDITSLFDLKRTEYNGDDMSMSPLQTKEGRNKPCPYCSGEFKQPVVSSNTLGEFKDSVVNGARNIAHKIRSGDGFILDKAIPTDECLNCGGTGVSSSSREGDFIKEPLKYGDVDPVQACLEILDEQYKWLEECKKPIPNGIYECKEGVPIVKTHIDDKGNEVTIEQTEIRDRYDALKALGLNGLFGGGG